MIIEEVNQIRPDGIWEITDVYPEKNKHRLNRFVVFPFSIIVNASYAKWIYVNYFDRDEKAGGMCSTSLVKKIQLNEDGTSIQISTQNSQYVFDRRM